MRRTVAPLGQFQQFQVYVEIWKDARNSPDAEIERHDSRWMAGSYDHGRFCHAGFMQLCVDFHLHVL